ncbi:MAG: sulfite exporter TauE/SafE family protein [Eubacterium sp.]|nr:sulfite exporter TauE/SafE family protein [Eubacterium sp.]
MYDLIYSLIIFFATFMGSFVGLGGGVIIKAALDLIGHDSVATVNFISCCAVFSMSISSTIKHIRAKTKIDFKFIVTLSIGAVAGGIIGSALFDYLLTIFDSVAMKRMQGVILCLLLVASVIYINLKNRKSFTVKNSIGIIGVGLLLGLLSSFLGVGGGPMNVAFLILFFSMTSKESAVYSVGVIFFSQLSKLITMVSTNSIPEFNYITLILAIATAIIGGILGARMNKRSNEKTIKTVFTIVVACVAGINLCNAII